MLELSKMWLGPQCWPISLIALFHNKFLFTKHVDYHQVYRDTKALFAESKIQAQESISQEDGNPKAKRANNLVTMDKINDLKIVI